ncbi:hypothetical protein [Desulfoferrobacter suflitae]|uniref:hypothetical protein n=1 Tax=Desulfoferrobacter suflitae TaxID=2865782 RepID=UPI0021643B48|nr:hypothetical protein [Desulfoferrobacter suflitae]MCK8600258.1 hypothetical protein [Desulfoferrobacter suflitae]
MMYFGHHTCYTKIVRKQFLITFLSPHLSGVLIVLTYPKKWIQEAREKDEEEYASEDEGFDWRQRIRSCEGWRVALFVAVVMYVSIVATAVMLNFSFALLGVLPESSRQVKEITQFQIDYTFWMNLAAIAGTGVLYYLHRSHVEAQGGSMEGMEDGKKFGIKQLAVVIAILALCRGLASFLLQQV